MSSSQNEWGDDSPRVSSESSEDDGGSNTPQGTVRTDIPETTNCIRTLVNVHSLDAYDNAGTGVVDLIVLRRG